MEKSIFDSPVGRLIEASMIKGGGEQIEVEALSATENGTYTAESGKAYSPVTVDVEPGIEALSVSANGTYTAPDGTDGYSPVVVDVEPDLEALTATQNGSYTPSTGKDGFSSVTVSVTPDLVQRAVTENGYYAASASGHEGFSAVDVYVRGDFLPTVADGYEEYKDVVQSSYVKSMLSTAPGSTVTVRIDKNTTVAVNDKVLFDGTDTTTHLTYAAWGVVTATHAYTNYRSVTLRIAGASARATASASMAVTGYGSHNVVGDLAVQVASNLETISSYAIAQNGQQIITPSAGYDGIASITVDVNVSGGGGGGLVLDSLTAQADGTYAPQTGHAYGSVTVNTGQAGYGNHYVGALNIELNGTFTPTADTAFAPVTVDVQRGPWQGPGGTETVIDATFYCDGTFVAAAGYAFGEITVDTAYTTAQSVTVDSAQTITANGTYGDMANFEACGELVVDVAASSGSVRQCIYPFYGAYEQASGANIYGLATTNTVTADDFMNAYAGNTSLSGVTIDFDSMSQTLPSYSDQIVVRGTATAIVYEWDETQQQDVPVSLTCDIVAWGVVSTASDNYDGTASISFSDLEGVSVVDPDGQLLNTAFVPTDAASPGACVVVVIGDPWMAASKPYTIQVGHSAV